MLTIRLNDGSAAPELLGHLRACGCIAYADGAVIRALLPEADARDEEYAVRSWVESWLRERPCVTVAVSFAL
jgi:hypothetical protein